MGLAPQPEQRAAGQSASNHVPVPLVAPLRSSDRAKQCPGVYVLERPGAHSLHEELNTEPGGNTINYSPQSYSKLPLIS